MLRHNREILDHGLLQDALGGNKHRKHAQLQQGPATD
jgi:hypothetical protein